MNWHPMHLLMLSFSLRMRSLQLTLASSDTKQDDSKHCYSYRKFNQNNQVCSFRLMK